MARSLNDKIAAGVSSQNVAAPPAAQGVATLAAAEAKVAKILCAEIVDESAFGFAVEPLLMPCVVLPYHHVSFADMDKKATRLHLVTWTHDVVIEGRNLVKVRDALRRSRDMVLRAVDSKFAQLYVGDDVFISSIKVEERKDDDDEPSGGDFGEDPDASEMGEDGRIKSGRGRRDRNGTPAPVELDDDELP